MVAQTIRAASTLPANLVVFAKVDPGAGVGVIGSLKKRRTCQASEPASGAGFCGARCVESFEGQSSDGLLDAFAGFGVVVGDDHVGSQRANCAYHPAKRVVVSPNAQGFIG